MSKRGLVLGGGGITGIAWEIGLLAGLAEAGVDVSDADRIVGTSAGSIVGAQLCSGLTLDELYRRQLEAVDLSVPLAVIGRRVLVEFAVAMLRARGDLDAFGRVLAGRAEKAAAAGRTPTVAERYEQVRLRLVDLEWPDRDLVVTAVDAATGELVAFGPRGSRPEVGLEDAVNASCAVPCVYPPIPIDGRTYVDGGVRSGANADLAVGCDPVLVLSPMDRSVGVLRSATQQLGPASDGGLDVRHLVITPDEASRTAIGRNVLDPSARPPSARAGYAQAVACVDTVAALWNTNSSE